MLEIFYLFMGIVGIMSGGVVFIGAFPFDEDKSSGIAHCLLGTLMVACGTYLFFLGS